jgi:hypothetical protein
MSTSHYLPRGVEGSREGSCAFGSRSSHTHAFVAEDRDDLEFSTESLDHLAHPFDPMIFTCLELVRAWRSVCSPLSAAPAARFLVILTRLLPLLPIQDR